MTIEQIKDHLKKAGVKNLQQFGYPVVNTENIMTDEIYSAFFKSMLEDNKGKEQRFDLAIDELLCELIEDK